jgi:hypothetical protein
VYKLTGLGWTQVHIPDGFAKEFGVLVRCSCERIQEEKRDFFDFFSLDGGDDQLHK